MNRFVFEFDGRSPLSVKEFFANGVPEEITMEEISKTLDGVSAFDLMNDWNLSGDLYVTLMDVETGAIWQNTGTSWHLIQDRYLLPGEQRLFE